ncbi:leucine-rich repeat-containing protein 40 [Pholiota molesta]|nr:leucine-rich repeat-containing protein 40 [Pholiota molesta]
MSRIPQPSSRSGIKPPSTPVKSRLAPPSEPVRARTISTPRATTPRSTTPSKLKAPPSPAPAPPPMPGNALSIKEAIALKRAEAKKATGKSSGGGLDDLSTLEDALSTTADKEDDDLLGRLSVRETIEQARSTGSLNLATRSLPCLPSALFEIHLGLTPDALRSVPNEPVLPPSEPKPSRRGGQSKPAWFEAQDLTVLKAWNNEIQEVQHEISLFGSLKTIDASLHKNKLTSLPTTFADLTSLTVLDLSHNALVVLPEKIFALPELTTLNLSHNLFTALPFNSPFVNQNGRAKKSQQSSGGFFTPVVSHSTTPLPRLVNLDVSNNQIHAKDIDSSLPVSLVKVNLSGNPLGFSQELLRNLSSLKKLKEIKFEKCEIGDDSFPPSLFNSPFFQALRLLDLSETQVNLDSVTEAFKDIKQELNFDFSTEDPPEGVTRILVGKRIIKEPWELELERRANLRKAAPATPVVDDWDEPTLPSRSTTRASNVSPTPAAKSAVVQEKKPVKPKEVIKEAWEIEAEQGLSTEGGRRRARAAAAAAAQAQSQPAEKSTKTSASSSPTPSSPTSSSSLSNPQYFTQSTQTLKLPASAPPTKAAGHARAFSMASPSASFLSTMRSGDLSVPTPTLPLSVIVNQPFADTLRVLILVNRRMDRSFTLPSAPHSVSGFLPKLEELDLEGCNLKTCTPPRSDELLIPTLTKLFPSLRTLNLSYNALSNSSLTSEALTTLILASPHRQGLRHLRLRGNRISDLDGFLGLAEGFKGNRNVAEWKLEELDLRDNEIGKLPPELGLLPLDVFLVDGNTFRVPQRRVWEREGTKGLLSWLRGRIE